MLSLALHDDGAPKTACAILPPETAVVREPRRSPNPLILRNGPLQCGILPDIGGSIEHLTYHDGNTAPQSLLRPPDGDTNATRPATALGCFPLVPFSNRIAQGRFVFEGRSITLPPTPSVFPHAMHGHGWVSPWQVLEACDQEVHLEYRHHADAWPFDYVTRQRFTLLPDRLRIEITLTNTGSQRMPGGLGIHPYFPKPPGTRLTARLGGLWMSDASKLPTTLAALPPEWDFHRGRPLDRLVMDNSFTGWDGIAQIDWPHRMSLRITANSTLSFLMIYTPQDGDYFCLEPVSHMIDAVNHSDIANGIKVLATNESIVGVVNLQVLPGPSGADAALAAG
ncbi:MAG: aldose 1-epimerase [Azospirillaceae bacterium]|nr:aldose 1-epimerase [Azospirillaceae bacterium]